MSGKKVKRLRKRIREQAVKEVKGSHSDFVNSLGLNDRIKLAVRLLQRKF